MRLFVCCIFILIAFCSISIVYADEPRLTPEQVEEWNEFASGFPIRYVEGDSQEIFDEYITEFSLLFSD